MIKKTGIFSLFFAMVFMALPVMALPLTININSADTAALAKQLTGIGLTKAAAIVDYREKNGPFAAIEDIVLVKGIGWKTMEANRDIIRLRDKETKQAGILKDSKSGKDAGLDASTATSKMTKGK